MTVIALLRGSGQPLPFFDTDLLRELLEDALAEDSTGTLAKARAEVDALDQSLKDYRASIERTLDAYIEESENRYTSAAELIERIEPLDRKRAEMLRDVIQRRQALLNLLDEQQCTATFA
jgi:hypothetical protein